MVVGLLPVLALAQSTDQNYVKTTTYQVATQNGTVGQDNKIEVVNYADGLGRPVQTIAAQAGGDREDNVKHITYDVFGTSSREYLPWAGFNVNSLNYIAPSTLQTNIDLFYNTVKYDNTANPYSERVYEVGSGRTLEIGAPGNDWAIGPNRDLNHTIRNLYRSNEVDDVREFSVSFSGSSSQLVYEGYYPRNELYLTITKDENWQDGDVDNNTVQEFTNKQGQMILKRAFNNGVAYETYYVYDDYGLLTFVMSPELSANIISGGSLASNHQQLMDDLGYQYKYDHRNRLSDKKVPGKGWEYIIYDKLDRPAFTQDAEMRQNNQWLFTKYDAIGRVAYTGIMTSNYSRSGIIFQLSIGDQYESREINPNVVGTTDPTQIYYSDNGFISELGDVTLHSINYYDDYVDTATMTMPGQNYFGVDITTDTAGLPTVNRVRVLGTTQWITSMVGYDEKGRSIFTETDNPYLGSHDLVQSLLDFTGKPVETRTTHAKSGLPLIVIADYFTYDHQSRLLTHEQKIDDEPVQLIVSNNYDELGRLTAKDVGGETIVDGYTDVTAADVTADGTIDKNISTNGWNSGAKTRGEITEDGGVEFTVVHSAWRHYKVGLVEVGGSYENGWGNYDFAIYIRGGDHNGDGTGPDVDLMIGNTITHSGITTYSVGDVFKVERVGSNIVFKKGTTTLHTEPFNNTSRLIGKVGLYSYNAAIADMALFGPNDRVLQKVNYAYNVRGWLTDINSVPTVGISKGADLFNFRINYNQLEGNATGTPLYNGNIAQTLWATTNTDNDIRGYAYDYDDMNRITGARSYTGNTLNTMFSNIIQDVSGISYDRNGNILTLTRRGFNDTGTNNGVWDDLVYGYEGNQLKNVTDNAFPTLADYGFDDVSNNVTEYLYDDNGNMTRDDNKGITSITYNHLNLPTVIVFGSSGQIQYIYDATGVKLKKMVTEGSTNTLEYDGNFVYENGVLQFFNHLEGYVIPVANTSKSTKGFKGGATTYSQFEYVFQFKDHLGSVRLSYGDDDGNGSISGSEIIEESNYYPFGLKQKGYNQNIAGGSDEGQKWKYQGQEFEEDLGKKTYAYQWRDYDPALGRFGKIDRFAEKYISDSPYSFSKNNPIRFQEIAGDSLWITFGENNEHRALYQDGELLNADGSRYEGEGVKVTRRGNIRITNSFLKKATKALDKIVGSNDDTGIDVVGSLQDSDHNFTIAQGGFSRFDPGTFDQPMVNINLATYNQLTETGISGQPFWNSETASFDLTPASPGGTGGIIYWSGNDLTMNGGQDVATSMSILAHELFHAYDANTGSLVRNPLQNPETHLGDTEIGEVRAVVYANKVRSSYGQALRKTYSNNTYQIPSQMPPTIQLRN